MESITDVAAQVKPNGAAKGHTPIPIVVKEETMPPKQAASPAQWIAAVVAALALLLTGINLFSQASRTDERRLTQLEADVKAIREQANIAAILEQLLKEVREIKAQNDTPPSTRRVRVPPPRKLGTQGLADQPLRQFDPVMPGVKN